MPGGNASPPPSMFLLEPSGPGVIDKGNAPTCPVIQIRPVQAAPGYLTDRMLYVRRAHQLEYFAQSRWVDVPARMMEPHLLQSLSAGGFARVVRAGAPVRDHMRLEVTQFRLHQEFDGDNSVVVLSLEAALFDTHARSRLGRRSFVTREAGGTDARSGVLAANRALGQLLDDVADFTRAALPPASEACR